MVPPFDPNEEHKPIDQTAPSEDQKRYMDAVNKYKLRCAQWAKAHGNINFPIVETPEGALVWLNRAARRLYEARVKRNNKSILRAQFLNNLLNEFIRLNKITSVPEGYVIALKSKFMPRRIDN